MNEQMRSDYAIYCSAGRYENRDFYKFYSINNQDLIAYGCKLATCYEVSDAVYETHMSCIKKCINSSKCNKRMFVKVEIDADQVTWIREVFTVDQILQHIIGEQFQYLIEKYYKHWDILCEKRYQLESVVAQIENLEKERKLLEGWMPVGLYDADDYLFELSDDEDEDEVDVYKYQNAFDATLRDRHITS